MVITDNGLYMVSNIRIEQSMWWIFEQGIFVKTPFDGWLYTTACSASLRIAMLAFLITKVESAIACLHKLWKILLESRLSVNTYCYISRWRSIRISSDSRTRLYLFGNVFKFSCFNISNKSYREIDQMSYILQVADVFKMLHWPMDAS